jgi:hypothetical protein
MKHAIILLITVLMAEPCLKSQTIYVNARQGNDDAQGTAIAPFKSLQKAAEVAKVFSGDEPVMIKLAPGLYELMDRLDIQTKNNGNGAKRYTLEALIMPDDSTWKPWLMPIIQSISSNNDYHYFDHCAGILADRANVAIRGIKFIGNANPGVEYYYPVEKDTTTLNNLEISQCYFIGDRYGAVVQGAIYAEGPGIHVDHCIFYGCKNAVLCFQNLSGFSFRHSIIYGAYECAVWYGDSFKAGTENPFDFSNNIVSHCKYFWAASKGHDHRYYHFDHLLVCENEHYIGMQDGKGGVMLLSAQENYVEKDVRKNGKVRLVEVETNGFPAKYLNLRSDSDGIDLKAGIFKR